MTSIEAFQHYHRAGFSVKSGRRYSRHIRRNILGWVALFKRGGQI